MSLKALKAELEKADTKRLLIGNSGDLYSKKTPLLT